MSGFFDWVCASFPSATSVLPPSMTSVRKLSADGVVMLLAALATELAALPKVLPELLLDVFVLLYALLLVWFALLVVFTLAVVLHPIVAKAKSADPAAQTIKLFISRPPQM